MKAILARVHAHITLLLMMFLAGCASAPTEFTPRVEKNIVTTAAIAGPNALERCVGLNSVADASAAVRMDLPTLMLTQLKTIGKVDNEGVCRMPYAQRDQMMAAYRNQFRHPRRAEFRAPAREWVRTWDMDENGRLPNSTDTLAAEAARKALATVAADRKIAGISQTSWQFIGPGNVGGRIRAILIDPRNTNRLFIGAATGGVWRTENGGQSYTPVSDFIGSIAIGAMAFDSRNPDVIYAGTGESFTGLSGAGLFKSTNGGTSWGLVASTNTDTSINPDGDAWGYVNRIAVHPNNPDIMVVGTSWFSNSSNGAVFRTSNGGASWARTQLPGNTEALDVQWDPNNVNNLLIGSDDGYVYVSRDGGISWTRSNQLVTSLVGRGSSARIEIAYARSTPDLVYASVDNNTESSSANTRGQVWRSIDGGNTWERLSDPRHLGSQGDYDNTIWVDPIDSQHIVVGGLDLYQSRDGGMSFTRISTWQAAGPALPQPHADHHVIVSVPNYSDSNRVVYFGNDGGVYRANDMLIVSATGTSSWVNLNNDLGVTQFYGGAGKRAAGGKVIGGTQDNGALQLQSGTNWFRTAGGDGGYAAVDPIDDTTIYGEYVYASIHRKIGNATRQYICNGITEGLKDSGGAIYCGPNATEETNFISPFILDPNNRDRMLVGANSLWVSNNVRTGQPVAWSVLKPPLAAGSQRQYINAIDVAVGNANIIWVGHNSPGGVYKTTNALTTNPVWTRMGVGVLPTSTVTRVTIDPDNPNRVWVAFTAFSPARLWVTEDGGDTWRNIHNNLPRVSLFDIKRHPTNPNWLYVAAANGVYSSEDAGATWSSSNDGPNSVRVRELFWYDNTTLIAATYGRSMWRTTVTGGAATAPLNYSDMWWAGPSENGWGMSIQQHANGVQFNALYVYDAQGKPVWYVMPGGTWSNNFTTYTGVLYQPSGSPLNAYNAQQLQVGASVGSVTLNFSSSNNATLNYTINGISGSKAISRQPFSGGAAPFNVADLWWAGNEENGWGINLAQNQGTIFAVWYTYGQDGKATWYVLPGGSWIGNTYSGTFYSTTGAAWLGATYDPKALTVNPMGTLTFNFSSANAASMTYQFTAGAFSGTTQTKNLQRQMY